MLACLAFKREKLLAVRRQIHNLDSLREASLTVISDIDEMPKRELFERHHIPTIRAMLSYDPTARPTARSVEELFGAISPCCRAISEPFAITQESPYGDITLQTSFGDAVLEDETA